MVQSNNKQDRSKERTDKKEAPRKLDMMSRETFPGANDVNAAHTACNKTVCAFMLIS